MDLYQHFRKDEQPFIDTVLSWKEEVERSYIPKLTDFLDPREQHIMRTIIGNHPDLILKFFGGYEGAERQRAFLAPFYEEVQDSRFQLILLEAKFPKKFIQLDHRDVLGALMSLGIKRKKFGDLIIVDDIIQIVADEELAIYLKMNLTSIKHANLSFTDKHVNSIIVPENQWHERSGTVSSLRLDAVLKEVYQISRQKASEGIVKGAVKVNFRVVEDPSFQVEQGDMISFRKKGRSKLIAIEGKTKKEKWRITTATLK
ncbi:RNA-binding protein [Salirhabdus salicampi]|uniref:YlmH family RNA-binding protein n=1 Tax=Salirhabdus salicampi TaxID=476102 RepID=UPI0020C23CA5|nr:YlmH/Sll1252 family protein [Salirhabdus salicampi]